MPAPPLGRCPACLETSVHYVLNSDTSAPAIAFTASGGDDTDLRDLVYPVCRPHISYITGESRGLARADCRGVALQRSADPGALRDGLVITYPLPAPLEGATVDPRDQRQRSGPDGCPLGQRRGNGRAGYRPASIAGGNGGWHARCRGGARSRDDPGTGERLRGTSRGIMAGGYPRRATA